MKYPKPKRVRLSLETTEDFKDELIEHGKALGEWSLIGALRRSLSRSSKLLALEMQGKLFLCRDEDDEIVEIDRLS